jgi:hypothetical protein
MNTNTTGGAITAVVATGLLGLVVKQALDFVKHLRAGDWNAVVTQLGSAVVGFGAITLFAHSQFGAATIPGLDEPVRNLGWAEAAIAALTLFGISGFVNDRQAAVDNTRSSATPPLLPPAAPKPAPAAADTPVIPEPGF